MSHRVILLDTVLITLVNLYWQYLDPALDSTVCTAILASLEKRWAKADQSTFILAVILNPYIHASTFSTTSPYRTFDKLWELVDITFVRFYSVHPDTEFRVAFSHYIHGTGDWNDEKMGLAVLQAAADHEVCHLNAFSWPLCLPA
jgi:hypothetical protein